MRLLTYFAYGSNMSVCRLRARIPSAECVGPATLHGHALAFHKVSTNDGSGKCDVVRCDAARVLGVLFRLDARDKPVLDRIEGLGIGYREREVGVETTGGERIRALTYVATLTDPRLKPFDWYRRHVLEGAREAGHPEWYLAAIEAWPCIRDPDCERAARELAIYD